jgi:hypothetical protein
MTLNVSRVTITVTLKCNLYCKLCAASSPYYKNPWHPSTDEVLSDVDRLFEIISHTGVFVISGGEPLIRSDFDLIIQKISQYNDRIERLDILTNGTVVPNDSVFEAIENYPGKIRIVIDNYGTNLSKNAVNLYERLKCTPPRITPELRDYFSDNLHCNGWVDYAIGEKNRTAEETQAMFAKCVFPNKFDFCLNIVNGIMYACPRIRRLVELGYLDFDPSDCINLFDKSYTDDEIRGRILNIRSFKTLQACKYCDGMHDDSKRFKPAEQLSREEINAIKNGTYFIKN